MSQYEYLSPHRVTLKFYENSPSAFTDLLTFIAIQIFYIFKGVVIVVVVVYVVQSLIRWINTLHRMLNVVVELSELNNNQG